MSKEDFVFFLQRKVLPDQELDDAKCERVFSRIAGGRGVIDFAVSSPSRDPFRDQHDYNQQFWV